MKKNTILSFSALAVLLTLAACDNAQEASTAPEIPAAEAAFPPASDDPIAVTWQSPAEAVTPEPQTNASYLLGCAPVSSILPNIAPLLHNLSQAAEQRDVAYIESVLYENIQFSFGGDYGKENFLHHWVLDTDPQTSDFWPELSELLRLGGYAAQDEQGVIESVVFPCTFQGLPANNWLVQRKPDISPYEYVVVVQENATLNDEEGNPVRTLELGEVLFSPNDTHEMMRAHDGLRGFVSPQAVRAPIDYRMFLQQESTGQWKITLFIAGD